MGALNAPFKKSKHLAAYLASHLRALEAYSHRALLHFYSECIAGFGVEARHAPCSVLPLHPLHKYFPCCPSYWRQTQPNQALGTCPKTKKRPWDGWVRRWAVAALQQGDVERV